MREHPTNILKQRLIAGALFVGLVGRATAAEAAASDSELFAPDRVIQIEVTMDPQDWQALRISHRTTGDDFSQIVETPYDYYRADVVVDGRAIKSVGIRKKGFFGSAVSTRPSLKIKLDEYVKDQEFGGLDTMTFNNNNQDATQAQQFIVYKFMNQAGALSPRSSLARIVVNGEDLGIYTHVESIRKPFVKRLFKKANGDLYEGFAGDFTTNEFNRIVHKFGPDEDRGRLRELYDLLQRPDPVPVGEFEKLLDLDAFITLWASETLIGHWDGYAGNRNNFYVYRDRGTERFYFLPWGADSAFNDPGPFIRIPVPKSIKARGYLCRRLWESPEVRTRYRREMQRLLDNVWVEEKLLADLKRVHGLTREYNTAPEALVSRQHRLISEFIQNRRRDIQAELDAPAPDWPDLGAVFDPGTATIMEITGEFSSLVETAEYDVNSDSWASTASIVGRGDANIEFMIEGRRHKPFNRYGARTTLGNPHWIRRGYPVVEIEAVSDSEGFSWNLYLIIDPNQIAEGKNRLAVDHFTVWARLMQNDAISKKDQRQGFGISGTLELDEYSSAPGGRVAGRFRLKSAAFDPREQK